MTTDRAGPLQPHVFTHIIGHTIGELSSSLDNHIEISKGPSKIDPEHVPRLSAILPPGGVVDADGAIPTGSTATLSDETIADRSGRSVDPLAVDEAKSVAGSG